MSKLKPLEQLANDVQRGDLVRVQIPKSDYVGYKWDCQNDSAPLLDLEGADIILSGLNPFGNTNTLYKNIQYVGINLKEGKLRDEPIEGYEVLRRAKK